MDELTGGRQLLDVGDLEIAHTRTGTAPEDRDGEPAAASPAREAERGLSPRFTAEAMPCIWPLLGLSLS